MQGHPKPSTAGVLLLMPEIGITDTRRTVYAPETGIGNRYSGIKFLIHETDVRRTVYALPQEHQMNFR